MYIIVGTGESTNGQPFVLLSEKLLMFDKRIVRKIIEQISSLISHN